jgi:sarcosine oxidase subunit delta
MQLFSCPFCGLRDETEFTFATEAGKVRPEPAAEVSADAWARYLHFDANLKGATREVWLHQPCGEFFVMERDTVSHVVKGEGR